MSFIRAATHKNGDSIYANDMNRYCRVKLRRYQEILKSFTNRAR